MNIRDKKPWYVIFVTIAGLLLINPLFLWGGLSRPLYDGSIYGSNIGRIFVFLISGWGMRDALNGMLEISLGKLFPTLIYKTPSVEI